MTGPIEAIFYYLANASFEELEAIVKGEVEGVRTSTVVLATVVLNDKKDEIEKVKALKGMGPKHRAGNRKGGVVSAHIDDDLIKFGKKLLMEKKVRTAGISGLAIDWTISLKDAVWATTVVNIKNPITRFFRTLRVRSKINQQCCCRNRPHSKAHEGEGVGMVIRRSWFASRGDLVFFSPTGEIMAGAG